MHCCPAGSWSDLAEVAEGKDYVPKGQIVEVDGLKVYKVGESERCLIWNYDRYGLDNERSKMWCDNLAAKGYMVLMPDYLRGHIWDKIDQTRYVSFADYMRKNTNWDLFKKDFQERILPLAQKSGAKCIGSISTCWGSYVGLRIATFPEVSVTVSMHPSHPILMSICNDDEPIILGRLTDKSHLMMPASNDHAHVKAGGLAAKVLGKRLTITEFPNMVHGWTVRGDEVVDPEVVAATAAAFDNAVTFLDTNLSVHVPVKESKEKKEAKESKDVKDAKVIKNEE